MRDRSIAFMLRNNLIALNFSPIMNSSFTIFRIQDSGHHYRFSTTLYTRVGQKRVIREDSLALLDYHHGLVNESVEFVMVLVGGVRC